METMPVERIDPLGNSRKDYRQDREELSVRYYGCAFRNLTRPKKRKVSAWVRNRRERELARKEHYEMPVHDVLTDYHERTYGEDESSTIRRVDLKRAFDRLKKTHGEVICEAAAGILSKSEAAQLLGRRKADVCLEVDKANAEAVELLRDYAPCLPADLRQKYQR